MPRRRNFNPPLTAEVGDTGYELHLTAAEPKGVGYVASISVWNGRIEWGPNSVLITESAEVENLLVAIDADMQLGISSIPGWDDWRTAARDLAGRLGEQTTVTARATADRLVDYALQAGTELFEDQFGSPHLLVEGQPLRLSLSAARARDWLRRLFWDKEGKSVPSDALATALGTLAAKASGSKLVYPLEVRSHQTDDSLWIELRPGRAVRIQATGWDIVDQPPALFRQLINAHPLPDPVRGGTIDGWLDLIPTKDARCRRLLRAYIETAYLDVARPILQPTGPGGSGKTTLCLLIKRVLDPSVPESIRLDQRDILQKASHCHTLFLDNVSSMADWAVDTLCRLCTGEGDSKRQLYSDDDDVIIQLRRLVLINGVNPPAERADFNDRLIPIALERIPKPMLGTARDAGIERELPGWLGAICTALQGILGRRSSIHLDPYPRLSDWGRAAAASYVGAGLTTDDFLEDWQDVVRQQQSGVIEGSSLAQCVLAHMQKLDEWQGRSTQLYELLEQKADSLRLDIRHDRSWPKSASWLWRRLKEIAHVLAARDVHSVRLEDEGGTHIILYRPTSAYATDAASAANGADSSSKPPGSSPGEAQNPGSIPGSILVEQPDFEDAASPNQTQNGSTDVPGSIFGVGRGRGDVSGDLAVYVPTREREVDDVTVRPACAACGQAESGERGRVVLVGDVPLHLDCRLVPASDMW